MCLIVNIQGAGFTSFHEVVSWVYWTSLIWSTILMKAFKDSSCNLRPQSHWDLLRRIDLTWSAEQKWETKTCTLKLHKETSIRMAELKVWTLESGTAQFLVWVSLLRVWRIGIRRWRFDCHFINERSMAKDGPLGDKVLYRSLWKGCDSGRLKL